MSEKVQYFNPFLILIWILQLIILAMDYSDDNKVTWSIPVIGSFLLIQLYMVWKTNYDEMVEEQNQKVMKQYGTDSTPVITPGVTNLQTANSTQDGSMIQLNLAPSVHDDDESE
ncbi:MAG: hypothetical protein ACW99A_17270 [Candidatus Kariarchaeaceae archaeon]|jgi:hypothetical protein